MASVLLLSLLASIYEPHDAVYSMTKIRKKAGECESLVVASSFRARQDYINSMSINSWQIVHSYFQKLVDIDLEVA